MWIHTAFVLLWLPYFTLHDALKIHPCCREGKNLLLCGPLYVGVTLSLCYVPADAQSGCSYLLVLVNNAAVILEMHIPEIRIQCFWIYSEAAGLYGYPILRNLLFSIVAALFYIPTNSAQGLQYLHILYFKKSNHFNRPKIISYPGIFIYEKSYDRISVFQTLKFLLQMRHVRHVSGKHPKSREIAAEGRGARWNLRSRSATLPEQRDHNGPWCHGQP